MTKRLIKEKFDFLFKCLGEVKIKDLPNHPEIRGALFSLESILRLHIRGGAFSDKTKKVLQKNLESLKAFEDEIGSYSYSKEMVEYYFLKTKQENKKLKKNFKSSKKNFKTNFDSHYKALQKSYKSLMGIDWPNAKDFIPTALQKEVYQVDVKIATKLKPLLLKKKYSNYEIQEGLHEWRRSIRWVSIYFQTYKDLFHLSRSSSASKRDRNLVKTYKNDPFCILGSNEKSVKVSALAFYELSDYIKKVGDIKTEAEIPHSIHKLRVKISSKFSEEDVHKLYSLYEADNVLLRLINS